MDIILYNIGFSLLLLIFGYLCGSIPNGIWIGKLFFHKDPRDYGSGNSGGTNVGRVFGKKFGIIVVILDVCKVMFPIYMAWAFLTRVPMYNGLPVVPRIEVVITGNISEYAIQWPIYWLVALGAYFGHCFPIFAKFRGGKNVAVFYGVAVSCCWAFGWSGLVAFFIIALIKKMVSLASIISSWITVANSWIWAILILTKVVQGPMIWFVGYGPTVELNYVYAIVLTIGAIVLTIKHKANIERIKNGTENKIKWFKKSDSNKLVDN